MPDTIFNLADENWIRVMGQDCGIREVSLTDALVHAHVYKGLAGEMETQNVALLRLLIALAHTVFTRVNTCGEEDPVDSREGAVERWKELMENGKFPEQPVREYLRKWHDRFFLIHPSRPFYQVPEAGGGTPYSAAKLNGEVSKSGNKERLFSSVAGEGETGMTFPEGARWLLFINGFDDCAAKQKDKSEGKRQSTVAWLGSLGLVTACGENLFETILLNMTMLAADEELWEGDDLPVWELPEACSKERRTIDMPRDLAGLMTLQSRRILLKRENDRITGYSVLVGDAFPRENAFDEPMTLWRKQEDPKTKVIAYIPRRHDRARQIWRDFGTMMSTENGGRLPGVIKWCGLLRSEGILPYKRYITFRFSCVRYDKKSSSITDSFSDALSFHADLLQRAGQAWVRAITEEIENIENAAETIGTLARNLTIAAGLVGTSLKSEDQNRLNGISQLAKEQMYLSVDMPFRDWLLLIDPSQEVDERMELVRSWRKQAWKTVMNLGRQMVDESGENAFIGRMVTEKNRKIKKITHYSSPEAFSWFRRAIGEIYIYTKKEENRQNGRVESRCRISADRSTAVPDPGR